MYPRSVGDLFLTDFQAGAAGLDFRSGSTESWEVLSFSHARHCRRIGQDQKVNLLALFQSYKRAFVRVTVPYASTHRVEAQPLGHKVPAWTFLWQQ